MMILQCPQGQPWSLPVYEAVTIGTLHFMGTESEVWLG